MTTDNATQANADYLASKTGLTPAAALAWLQAEQQQVPNPTNPLNITAGGTPGESGTLRTSYGTFATYSSPQAGLDAAAWLIANGQYSGIRATLGTGDSTAQAKAIDASKWGTSGALGALGVTAAPAAAEPSAPTLESSTAQLTTQHWTTAQLAAGVATYEAIPAAQRTAKQSAALATDVATLAKDTDLQMTEAAPAEPALTTTLPPTTAQAGQVVSVLPSVSVASPEPAATTGTAAPVAAAATTGTAAPVAAGAPGAAAAAPAPAVTSSPLAGIDPMGLAALAIGGLALVLFLSAPSGAPST